MEQDDPEILAVVEASSARRWLAIAILMSLGMLTLYLAFTAPPALAWQVFLIGTGLGALWLADRLRRATAMRIELTKEGLRDNAGQSLAELRDIAGVERGVFAFKPSNGFLVKLKRPGATTWQTGLWWRLGRRIGVGGVTAASQTKVMADILAALVMERDGLDLP